MWTMQPIERSRVNLKSNGQSFQRLPTGWTKCCALAESPTLTPHNHVAMHSLCRLGLHLAQSPARDQSACKSLNMALFSSFFLFLFGSFRRCSQHFKSFPSALRLGAEARRQSLAWNRQPQLQRPRSTSEHWADPSGSTAGRASASRRADLENLSPHSTALLNLRCTPWMSQIESRRARESPLCQPFPEDLHLASHIAARNELSPSRPGEPDWPQRVGKPGKLTHI